MPRPPLSPRAGKVAAAVLACLLALAGLASFPPPPAAARRQTPAPPDTVYRQANLVSDLPGVALIQDPLLADPWAVTRAPVRPFAVANRATATASLYRGGLVEPLTRNLSPPAIIMPAAAGPAVGAVANSWPSDSPNVNAFVFTAECVNPPCPTGAAHFIFGTPTGRLAAWFPALGDTARIVSTRPGHGWTGLTLAESSVGLRLLAADFAGNHIDVFDGNFAPSSVPGNFADPTVPADFHPFNVQSLGGMVYVAYAKFDPVTGRHVPGAGLGFVRRFDADGVRDPAFAINGGELSAPYGLAISPASFAPHSSALLVGSNTNQGRIHAYNFETGAFRGALLNEAGLPVEIEHLRGFAFGTGLSGDPGTLYFAAAVGREQHGLFGSLRPNASAVTSLVEFSAAQYSVGEDEGHIDITVTRTGDTSAPASVDYATVDDAATQKRDYVIALGRLDFAPGETSQTFRVLVYDDNEAAGGTAPPLGLVLSNPSGAGLGARDEAVLSIMDRDFDTPKPGNPIDETQFFVRQHYLDFLNREPGAGGLAFWSNEIESCGADQQCREVRRINVSAAFFLSIEFQRTGLLAYLTHRAAFGARPLYGEFMRSTQALQRDYAFGAPGHEAQLEANKQRFFRDFVAGAAFADRYPTTLTPAQFVDALYANAGFTPSADERKAAVDEFGGAATTEDKAARARALRRVAESETFAQREFTTAFVLMEYFGYLRRDPDEAGFQHWLGKLNDFNGNFIQAEMVKAFISSIEYRGRFGPT